MLSQPKGLRSGHRTIDLHGSFGAADIVNWFDGHPDTDRDWDFQSHSTAVAVFVVDNVYEGLKQNSPTNMYTFVRRRSALGTFTSMELRELSHSATFDVFIHPERFERDDGSYEVMRVAKRQKAVVDVLQNYLVKERVGAPHRIDFHFCQDSVELFGDDKVVGLRIEVTELDGPGNVRGTEGFRDRPAQAVYRAVGYYSDTPPVLPSDVIAGFVLNDGGRFIEVDGAATPSVYITGRIKRGLLGLIGRTRPVTAQTVSIQMKDLSSARWTDTVEPGSFEHHLDSRGIAFTGREGWEGWEKRNTHEMSLGESHPYVRERVKAVPRYEIPQRLRPKSECVPLPRHGVVERIASDFAKTELTIRDQSQWTPQAEVTSARQRTRGEYHVLRPA